LADPAFLLKKKPTEIRKLLGQRSRLAQPEENFSRRLDTTKFLAQKQADLSITKSDSSDPVNAASSLTYTLTPSNAGPSTAAGVSVTDTLPAGVTFGTASGSGWTCAEVSGVVTCTRVSMGTGSAPAISITVTAPAEGGTITNNAAVSSSTTDPIPANIAVAETTYVNYIPVVTPPLNPNTNEGESKSFNLGSFADPDGSPWNVDVDWGDSSAHTIFGMSATGPIGAKSHIYAEGPNTYTVTVKVTDSTSLYGSATFQVTVNNVAPTVTITGPTTYSVYPVNTPVPFKGAYTDPGTADSHTARWRFDSITTPVQSVNGGLVSTPYPFTTAGVYQVNLTITDDDFGAGFATTVDGEDAYVVIYDPSADFVTGGGWIDSPAGASTAYPSAIGKANFGFVSKYQKGAKVPTGETEFQFKAGNLNFHSSTYEWLVVSGARAQYKGVGTINGAGNYGFLLTAIDSQINGGGNVDKFRIKI
jgi:uncharacterized repeat protein (TIGR01451 family)